MVRGFCWVEGGGGGGGGIGQVWSATCRKFMRMGSFDHDLTAANGNYFPRFMVTTTKHGKTLAWLSLLWKKTRDALT